MKIKASIKYKNGKLFSCLICCEERFAKLSSSTSLSEDNSGALQSAQLSSVSPYKELQYPSPQNPPRNILLSLTLFLPLLLLVLELLHSPFQHNVSHLCTNS